MKHSRQLSIGLFPPALIIPLDITKLIPILLIVYETITFYRNIPRHPQPRSLAPPSPMIPAQVIAPKAHYVLSVEKLVFFLPQKKK